MRSERTNTDIALRAFAIAAVVFNHAHVYGGASLQYSGGMTVLMMLSGFSFARFAMVGGRATEVLRGLWQVGSKLFLASVAMALVSFAFMRTFVWSELLLVSNWTTGSYVARFPIWYPEVLLQLFAGIGILFSIPAVARAFFRAPLMSSLLMLIAAVAIAFVARQFWSTGHLHHRLPHLLAWNFILGWLIFFALHARTPSLIERTGLVAVALVAGILGWSMGAPQGYWLGLAVALLVFVPSLPSTAGVTRFLSIVSQASLTIFMLHSIALGAYRALFPSVKVPALAFLFAMLVSLGVWLVISATLNTYRRVGRRVEVGRNWRLWGAALAARLVASFAGADRRSAT